MQLGDMTATCRWPVKHNLILRPPTCSAHTQEKQQQASSLLQHQGQVRIAAEEEEEEKTAIAFHFCHFSLLQAIT